MNSTNNGSTHGLVSHNCLIALAALSGANVIAHLIALPSLPAQIPPIGVRAVRSTAGGQAGRQPPWARYPSGCSPSST